MKVLIVSNDRALLRHVSRFLAAFGYETTQVADYQRAAQVAETISADLLLIDSESDFDGALDVCRAASGRDGSGNFYTLLLVADNVMNRLTDALEAGADDFLAKPVVYGEILMRLHAGTRAVEFQRRTRQQRRRDPITGLLTCAALHARTQAAGASQTSQNRCFACVMLNVDFLDGIRHRLGQQAEDDLLRQLGARLVASCKNDRADLAHFGDGLFCVLLPGTNMDEAIRWAEGVRREVADQEFLVGKTKVSSTLSIGVGGADTRTMSPEAVLEKSKQALKAAKASGHNCVVQADQFAEEESAWKELAAPGRLFQHTVASDVMLPCTVTLLASDTIRSADSLCRQTHLAGVAIVDDAEKLVGAVLAEDVSEYLQAMGDPEQPVSRVMLRGVDTVEEFTDFAELMRHFAENDSELVIVVDEGHPTGLVSAASLAALSQAPEQPAFCTSSPSMQSSYLQVADPLALQSATDTL